MRAVDLRGGSTGRSLGGGPVRVPFLVVLAALVAVGGLGLGLAYTNAKSSRDSNVKEATTLRAQLRATGAPAFPKTRPSAQDSGGSSTDAAVASLVRARRNWPGLLHAVGRALPPDVWLTSLIASSPGVTVSPPSGAGAPTPAAPSPGGSSSSSAAAGPTLALGGCAASQSAVGTALERVDRLPEATSANLGTSQTGTCGHDPAWQITVTLGGAAAVPTATGETSASPPASSTASAGAPTTSSPPATTTSSTQPVVGGTP
jgi:hypothetical protein